MRDSDYILRSTLLQWGTADAEIKTPSPGGSPGLLKLFLEMQASFTQIAF